MTRVVSARALALGLLCGCARVIEVSELDATIGQEIDVYFSPFDDATVTVDAGAAHDDDAPAGWMKGADVNPARDTGARVDTGSAPRDSGNGPAGCGAIGRDCCAGARCGASLTCAGNTCIEAPRCGAVGQPCCGVAACGPGLSCQASVCRADRTCGASGQGCCTAVPPCLSALTCVSGRCIPCGNVGQACCTGSSACNAPNLTCGAGWCRF
ncbi:MAG: hypothetical protein JNK72_16640 [Myxococcales bacterium]|nr:hypothetical protein [Myxococcales bacterium]